MKITITVWKKRSINGYDSAETRWGKSPIVNTVCVRYPNVDRKPGEPREVEKLHHVPCIAYSDPNALNTLGQLGAVCNKPDQDAIDKIIGKYKKIGEVVVTYNYQQ